MQHIGETSVPRGLRRRCFTSAWQCLVIDLRAAARASVHRTASGQEKQGPQTGDLPMQGCGVHWRYPPVVRNRLVVDFLEKPGMSGQRPCTYEPIITRNGWVNRAAEHDSDLASRRRERMAQEIERTQDDAVVTIRATLDKVKERIEGMDAEELSAGQIPGALRTLIELEFKVLGYEDRVALTGKDGGPVKVEAKTQHVFQPSKEVWDDILRKRAEFERLRDGDTDEDTVSDSL